MLPHRRLQGAVFSHEATAAVSQSPAPSAGPQAPPSEGGNASVHEPCELCPRGQGREVDMSLAQTSVKIIWKVLHLGLKKKSQSFL